MDITNFSKVNNLIIDGLNGYGKREKISFNDFYYMDNQVFGEVSLIDHLFEPNDLIHLTLTASAEIAVSLIKQYIFKKHMYILKDFAVSVFNTTQLQRISQLKNIKFCLTEQSIKTADQFYFGCFSVALGGERICLHLEVKGQIVYDFTEIEQQEFLKSYYERNQTQISLIDFEPGVLLLQPEFYSGSQKVEHPGADIFPFLLNLLTNGIFIYASWDNQVVSKRRFTFGTLLSFTQIAPFLLRSDNVIEFKFKKIKQQPRRYSYQLVAEDNLKNFKFEVAVIFLVLS